MGRKVFVNLPVYDINRTRTFFSALGFSFDPKFSNEVALCMPIGDDGFAMLLKREFFSTFTPLAVADAHKATEVLTAMSCDDRGEVDALMEKALAAGASEPRPAQDHGFMYGRAFADPDGHIWELFWMNPEAMNG
ncbi:MAG: glyoxalase [Hyphomicrobiales bacterium]